MSTCCRVGTLCHVTLLLGFPHRVILSVVGSVGKRTADMRVFIITFACFVVTLAQVPQHCGELDMRAVLYLMFDIRSLPVC